VKIKIDISEKEKKILLVIVVIVSIFIYLFNRRYLYVLDAEFEDNTPVSIVLKTGFILPSKTFIELKNGFEKTVRMYGYKIKVSKAKDDFDIMIDNKKVHTIYTLAHYDKTHKMPTGRIYV
jgi:hypothetical protein